MFRRAFGRWPNQSELARALDVGRTAVHHHIPGLVEDGLIDRLVVPFVELTAAGVNAALGRDLRAATSEAEYVESALEALRDDLSSPAPLRVTAEQLQRHGREGCLATLAPAVEAEARGEWARMQARAQLSVAGQA